MSQTFSCFVIGGDTLLTECGETLLQHGHTIKGVVTGTPRIAEWARQKNLQVIDVRSNYKSALAAEPFDYLFAITHLSLISDDVLSLPTRLAINFHDGPLPAYAGLNTPVWALINREPKYGITWHVITPGVDEGDILEQRDFEVAETETALSINTRCFALGLEAFSDLVGKLATNTEKRRPQDFATRTVFTRHQRPPAATFVDWNQSAASIAALVRALDHGAYANPIATPKVRVYNDVFVVTNAEEDTESEASVGPGVVASVDESGIKVGTHEGLLQITQMSYLCGTPITPEDFAKEVGLSAGQRFYLHTDEEKQRLTQLDSTLAKSETFWLRRLSSLEPIELPNAKAVNTDSATPTYIQRAFTTPASFNSSFKGAAALIAGLGAYLARTGSKTSFTLGFEHQGTNAELSELSHTYAKVVPLLFSFDPKANFAALYKEIEDELGRLARRKTHLRDLVSRNPELAAKPELKKGLVPVAINLGDIHQAQPAVGTQLTLAISEDGSQVKAFFHPEAVSEVAINTALQQIEIFFSNIANNQQTALEEVSLLSNEERVQVLKNWNQTAKEYNKNICIHEQFENQVSKTPDATAVVFEGVHLSYQELNRRANQLARHLQSLGVQPGQLVGINVERSVDFIVSVVGTLKSGAAYLPLDPSFPADRIAYMVEDAKAPVIITQDSLVPLLPKHSAQVVSIDGDSSKIQIQDSSNLPGSPSKSNDLSYVIYTSGSTGRPKGVMVEHRNVINFFCGMDDRIPLPADRQPCWLAVTSLSFDISVLELLWTLTRGFKVVIYKDRERSGDDSGKVSCFCSPT